MTQVLNYPIETKKAKLTQFNLTNEKSSITQQGFNNPKNNDIMYTSIKQATYIMKAWKNKYI